MEYSVQRGTQSVTVTQKHRGKNDTMFYCRDVRGALVFPGIKNPGYAGIFALRDDMNEGGKFPLQLIGEISDRNPSNLFKKLFTEAQQLSCNTFYFDSRNENRDLVSLFKDYGRHHADVSIRLNPAPFNADRDFALALIREYASTDNGILVDEGTDLYNQLSSILEEEIDSDFDQNYFAINALRYVVGSVEKNPWQAPNNFPVRRSSINMRGWT